MKVIYKWQALKIKIVRQICSAKEDEEADPPSIPTWLVSQYCKKMKPGIPSEDSGFYKKLSKLTILLEQWPYQMAWMLLVGALENLQQELGIEIRTRTGKQALRRSSRISLFAKILGNRGVSIKQEDYVYVYVYVYLNMISLIPVPLSTLLSSPSELSK